MQRWNPSPADVPVARLPTGSRKRRFSPNFCQCRDCQRATGSGHAPLLMLGIRGSTISGEIRYHEVVSANGNRIARGFCPACGSPVLIRGTIYPEMRFVYAASLDDPGIFRPGLVIWNSSACSWDVMDPSLETHGQGK